MSFISYFHIPGLVTILPWITFEAGFGTVYLAVELKQENIMSYLE